MQGVVVQFRVMDGQLSRGDIVKFMNTKCEYDIVELGVLAPKAVEVRGWLWGGCVCVCVGGGGLTPKHALQHLALTPLGQARGWTSWPAPWPPLHRAVQLVL